MEPAVALEDPALCAVRLGHGERVPARLAALLNPVDAATFHVYRLPARTAVELHYHDIDEYWMFLEGRPRVTLRGPQGRRVEVDLEPGDMVACLRGVEHTLWADHELVYYQFTSVAQGNERPGHLIRSVAPQ